VTAQQPHAGDTLVKGSVVHINVSRGAKPVPVPDVTNQPFLNAKSALEGQGFVVGRVDIQSDLAAGVVVATDPPPGTSVSKGTKITLSVSKGPATTQIPDVTTQNQADATSILQGAGLTVAVILDPVTDPSQDGVVTSQDPAAGADAKQGEVVTIHVGQLSGTPGGDSTTTTATTTTANTPTR
jgi:serine/threonine-protein kinase